MHGKVVSNSKIKDLSEEILVYDHFASLVAKFIKLMRGEGMVFGIYEPWGSRKSSLLDLIKYPLEKKRCATFQQKKPKTFQ